jgi:hypothetical protein
MTEKNLILLRTLCALNDIEGLKNFLQGIMGGESP